MIIASITTTTTTIIVITLVLVAVDAAGDGHIYILYDLLTTPLTLPIMTQVRAMLIF